MYNSKMYELGSKRSVIRELFEFGKKRAAEVGADKVYDFSLGNPDLPPPPVEKGDPHLLLQTGDAGAQIGLGDKQRLRRLGHIAQFRHSDEVAKL